MKTSYEVNKEILNLKKYPKFLIDLILECIVNGFSNHHYKTFVIHMNNFDVYLALRRIPRHANIEALIPRPPRPRATRGNLFVVIMPGVLVRFGKT